MALASPQPASRAFNSDNITEYLQRKFSKEIKISKVAKEGVHYSLCENYRRKIFMDTIGVFRELRRIDVISVIKTLTSE